MSTKSNEAQSEATEGKKNPSPHDRFVQSVLEIREVAESFFKAHLPPKLVQAINWSTFAIYDTARRVKGKNTSYTDITYHAKIKGAQGELLDIYLHVEHQSTIDYQITSRMYDYNSGLLLKHQKQRRPKQPLVANLVLYNGVRKNHPYHEDPYQYFDDPELARFVVSKPYILVNLNKMSDEELLSHGACGLMEVLLKRASKANFVSWLRANRSLVRSHASVSYLEDSLRYCLEVADADADTLTEAFASIDPKLNEPIMRAVQQIEARGRQEGRQEEKLGIARNMLHLNLGAEIVQQATGLSRQELARL